MHLANGSSGIVLMEKVKPNFKNRSLIWLKDLLELLTNSITDRFKASTKVTQHRDD